MITAEPIFVAVVSYLLIGMAVVAAIRDESMPVFIRVIVGVTWPIWVFFHWFDRA